MMVLTWVGIALRGNQTRRMQDFTSFNQDNRRAFRWDYEGTIGFQYSQSSDTAPDEHLARICFHHHLVESF